MKRSFIYLTSLLLLAGVSSCQKKLDVDYDNRLDQQPAVSSATRIMSLTGATELEINGQRLTSFMMPDKEGGYGSDQTRPTLYFPESGRLTTSFTVPLQFADAEGVIKNIRFSSLSAKSIVAPTRNFNAKNDYNNPRDYYHVFFSPNTGGLVDSLFSIPRSISPSANPQHFKIRLLNLGSNTDRFHTGALSVVLSNGQKITGLENIAAGSYSDYVELPFGTYQFRVLDAAGKQLPGKGSTAGDIYVLNPETGTLMRSNNGVEGISGFRDTWLTYAPLKSYQPGGVYTIAVASAASYSLPTGSPGETISTNTNLFQVFSDISEPVNQTYARMQAVNLVPGQEVNWQVNGQELGGSLLFTAATSYGRYTTGVQHVKVRNVQGAVLAEADLLLSPGDNITAWAYKNKEGQTAISFSANNLSSRYFGGTTGNDGSNSVLQDPFPHWVRFMNFCADIDEVSFTANNGQAFPGQNNAAALHLLLGKAVIDDPYVRMTVNNSSSLLAYASKPNVLPGDWMSDIVALPGMAFITNPALYPVTAMPNSEPGVYTVVLAGTTKAGAPAGEKARMIIIKHNQ